MHVSHVPHYSVLVQCNGPVTVTKALGYDSRCGRTILMSDHYTGNPLRLRRLKPTMVFVYEPTPPRLRAAGLVCEGPPSSADGWTATKAVPSSCWRPTPWQVAYYGIVWQVTRPWQSCPSSVRVASNKPSTRVAVRSQNDAEAAAIAVLQQAACLCS